MGTTARKPINLHIYGKCTMRGVYSLLTESLIGCVGCVHGRYGVGQVHITANGCKGNPSVWTLKSD